MKTVLNKQDALSAGVGITLSSLGICGGDLIWVLVGIPLTVCSSKTHSSLLEAEACGNKRSRAPDMKPSTTERSQEAGLISCTFK
jgi:hypothetical protein